VLDPAGLLAETAAGLRAHASTIRSAVDEACAAHDRSGWTGRRADEVRRRLEERRHAAHDVADECDRLAAQADGMAADYRASVRRMRRYEDDVRAWLHRAGADGLRLLHHPTLPPAGSPAWAQVLADARRAGAHL
jgi:hypothetical protein